MADADLLSKKHTENRTEHQRSEDRHPAETLTTL
jgi:hypothetical protein